MPSPVNQVTFGIPSSSADGRFYSRFPRGDKTFVGSASGAIGTVAAVTPGGSAAQTTVGPAHDLVVIPIEGSGTEWVTFGHVFPQGEVIAADNVVITDAANNVINTAQTDKRATYPDGSLKHAIMHAQLIGGQNYKIRTGTPPAGSSLTTADLLSVIPGDIARVTLSSGINGSAILRDLITSSSNRAAGGLLFVEQGPKVLGLLVAQNFATHLRATFHLRWYGGTTLWCSYLLENCYSDVAGSGTRNYRAVLNLNGADVFDSGVGAISHWNRSSWRRAAWSTGGSLYPHHNAQYMIDSGAVPQYETRQQPTVGYLNTLPQSPVPPMGRTSFWGINNNLDDVGYHPHKGILPVWDALYFTSLADRRAYNAMLTAHDSLRVAGYCWMDSTTGEHTRTSDRPTFSISGGTGYASGADQSSSPQTVATGYAQAPSIGFLPYLLTGDYAHLRALTGLAAEHAAWAGSSGNFTHSSLTVRRFSDSSMGGEGWAYRTIAQAAWALPDAHPSKSYFGAVVNGNGGQDEIGYVTPGDHPEKNALGCKHSQQWNDNGQYLGSLHNLFVQASGYVALDLGFVSVVPIAKYTGKFVAAVMGSTGRYPFENAARATFIPGPSAGTFYTTFAQFAANTSNVPASLLNKDSGTLSISTALDAITANYTGARNEIVGDMASPSDLYAQLQPAVSYLERLGIDGGFVCWYRTQLSALVPDWRQIPQFGIVARARRRPAYIRAAPLLQWTEIPNSASGSVVPSPVVPGNPADRIDAWGALCVQIKDSRIWSVGMGGHGNYSGNGAFAIALNTEIPAWSQVRGPTPTESIVLDVPYYADGRPNSTHGYYNLQVHNGLGRVVIHGLSFVYINAQAYPAVPVFDTAIGNYLPSNTYPDSADSNGICAKNVNLANECIYYSSTGSDEKFRRFNPGDGTTVQVGPTTNLFGQIYRAASVDPIRGRMLVSKGTFAGDSWMTISVDDGARTSVNPGAAADLARSSGSLDWDPIGNRHIFYVEGQNAYSIDPETLIATPLGISGSPPPPAFAPPPIQNRVGLFSRMRFVPELGAIVVVPSNQDNIYFARLY